MRGAFAASVGGMLLFRSSDVAAACLACDPQATGDTFRRMHRRWYKHYMLEQRPVPPPPVPTAKPAPVPPPKMPTDDKMSVCVRAELGRILAALAAEIIVYGGSGVPALTVTPADVADPSVRVEMALHAARGVPDGAIPPPVQLHAEDAIRGLLRGGAFALVRALVVERGLRVWMHMYVLYVGI